MEAKTFSIFVTGLVQGVGFRPFVYRIAHRTGVSGWVMNTGGGVGIMVSGTDGELNYFLEALRNEPPEASHVIITSWKPCATSLPKHPMSLISASPRSLIHTSPTLRYAVVRNNPQPLPR